MSYQAKIKWPGPIEDTMTWSPPLRRYASTSLSIGRSETNNRSSLNGSRRSPFALLLAISQHCAGLTFDLMYTKLSGSWHLGEFGPINTNSKSTSFAPILSYRPIQFSGLDAAAIMEIFGAVTTVSPHAPSSSSRKILANRCVQVCSLSMRALARRLISDLSASLRGSR